MSEGNYFPQDNDSFLPNGKKGRVREDKVPLERHPFGSNEQKGRTKKKLRTIILSTNANDYDTGEEQEKQ